MIVRNPTSGEVERAAEIASKAFPNLSLEHWLESFHTVAGMFGERFILVVDLDGALVSTLLCCPAPIVVGGAEVTHSSVGAVATLPEYRRMGCAGAMMTESVRLLRDEGVCTSSLWPFSYKYYRKFGWEVGAESRTYRASGKVFRQLAEPGKARAATNGDFRAISLLYDAYSPRHNCCTKRSDEWWRRIAKLPEELKMTTEPGRGAVVHPDEGFIDGYLVYDINTNEERSWVEIKEMIYASQESRRSMLALVASIDPEIDISFDTPSDDLFMHELPNPREVGVDVCPSFQFRIIDPPKATASLRPAEGVAGTFTFSLSDPVFEQGWHFAVEVANGEVAPCEPEPAKTLEMDVQTFAKLFSGYLKPLDAWGLGRIKSAEAGSVAQAGNLFSPLTPHRSYLDPG